MPKCRSAQDDPADVQIADRLEGHLQHRLPPSRRIDGIKPLNPSPTVTARMDPSKSDSTINVSAIDIAVMLDQDKNMRPFVEGLAAVVDDVVAGLDPIIVTDVEKLHDTEPVPSPLPKQKKLILNPEYVKAFGKGKAKKIAAGNLVVEDGRTYDQSLLKAMFSTVWFEWCFSVGLNGCAGRRNSSETG